jgi:hypothetical protein
VVRNSVDHERTGEADGDWHVTHDDFAIGPVNLLIIVVGVRQFVQPGKAVHPLLDGLPPDSDRAVAISEAALKLVVLDLIRQHQVNNFLVIVAREGGG